MLVSHNDDRAIKVASGNGDALLPTAHLFYFHGPVDEDLVDWLLVRRRGIETLTIDYQGDKLILRTRDGNLAMLIKLTWGGNL